MAKWHWYSKVAVLIYFKDGKSKFFSSKLIVELAKNNNNNNNSGRVFWNGKSIICISLIQYFPQPRGEISYILDKNVEVFSLRMSWNIMINVDSVQLLLRAYNYLSLLHKNGTILAGFFSSWCQTRSMKKRKRGEENLHPWNPDFKFDLFCLLWYEFMLWSANKLSNSLIAFIWCYDNKTN